MSEELACSRLFQQSIENKEKRFLNPRFHKCSERNLSSMAQTSNLSKLNKSSTLYRVQKLSVRLLAYLFIYLFHWLANST